MTERLQIAKPVVDLLRAPDGPRDRQLLLGDTCEVIGHDGAWINVRAAKDGYKGFVPQDVIAKAQVPTHRINTLATHAYADANMKSPDLLSLSFGSLITAKGESDAFVETEFGHIPKQHLVAADSLESDPIAVAKMFLGTPYLWGGNSRLGLDCSGLIQVGLLACGIPCPGDSGDQECAVGQALPAGTSPQQGDLLFWKGHVAWVYDAATLLHANAHHMAVRFEPLRPAIARIEAQGDGSVTSHKRL
ncbi:C40 family peptidase [Falsiruegeria mediterranea]|uniref:Gamma-D-glutamyl-L-lysine endopeptidase n=1 Tax=Falsiruegeria mediterranea M17 TaxID=1200281 RepID=A0A2R8C2Y1_9RHOB|nr:NlpC/P60 family protein [Falsiruegeria mediterranea]SPJ26788.1 Gamma-D-glutamyl-L-lysine endopeptidase [Falsiruegeria mediterranea M17]